MRWAGLLVRDVTQKMLPIGRDMLPGVKDTGGSGTEALRGEPEDRARVRGPAGRRGALGAAVGLGGRVEAARLGVGLPWGSEMHPVV